MHAKYGAVHMYQVCYLLIDSNFHMIAYFFFFTLAQWIVYANYMWFNSFEIWFCFSYA